MRNSIPELTSGFFNPSMNIFKSTIYHKTLKMSISVVVAISVFASAMPVQSVKAQSILTPFIDIFKSDTSTEAVDFPVAEDKKPVKTIKVVATAYNSDVAQTDSTPCITANGHNLCKQYEEQGFGNTIAANFLPMGTQVKFPEIYGDKIFIVRDRMNARYGYGRVDVWLPEHSEAKKFGVKRIEMEIF
ncbi:MAG TPA: hypothetical protein DEB09_05945 [Candidatus Magasanikbacteria bacterium]|nr:hypothetical protein [Candidatus Magasanikbacteria bacterium]